MPNNIDRNTDRMIASSTVEEPPSLKKRRDSLIAVT